MDADTDGTELRFDIVRADVVVGSDQVRLAVGRGIGSPSDAGSGEAFGVLEVISRRLWLSAPSRSGLRRVT